MNYLTGKHLDRRTLLRGLGCSIALPFLDAMCPALAGPANGAGKKFPPRIAVVYVPNGIVMNQWKPASAGAEFEFTRILKPLEPLRQDITVLSGLANHAADVAKGGGHAKAAGSFLSGAQPKYTAGADVQAGTTFDQIAAKQFAAETRVPSLQLGCEDARMVGNCDTGSSCAYTNTLSWKDPDTPLTVEVDPRSVFERLFGSIDPSLAPEVRKRDGCCTARAFWIRRGESAQKLEANLGAPDRRKMDEYLTSVREVEKRISSAEQKRFRRRSRSPPAFR